MFYVITGTEMLTLADLAQIAADHRHLLDCRVKEFDLKGRQVSFNKSPASLVMGVINLSPDSWYRESVCLNTNAAIQRARKLVAEGADLVDIGPESTLSHAPLVEANAQIERLIPIIEPLASEGILISAETYHPEVARRCLEAGAAVINWTGADGRDVYPLIAAHKAAIILCYVEGPNVREVGDFSMEDDMIPAMENHFNGAIREAGKVGVQKVFLDPGLGFYYRNLQDSTVRIRHQIKVFLNTFRLRKLGYPVCHALPHAFEAFGEEVRTAEAFFAVLAALGGTDLLRTHEVPKVRGVIKTLRSWTGKMDTNGV
jgi:dihydropteroate synthase